MILLGSVTQLEAVCENHDAPWFQHTEHLLGHFLARAHGDLVKYCMEERVLSECGKAGRIHSYASLHVRMGNPWTTARRKVLVGVRLGKEHLF